MKRLGIKDGVPIGLEVVMIAPGRAISSASDMAMDHRAVCRVWFGKPRGSEWRLVTYFYFRIAATRALTRESGGLFRPKQWYGSFGSVWTVVLDARLRLLHSATRMCLH